MLCLIKDNIDSMPVCKDLFDLLGDVYTSISRNKLHNVIDSAVAGINTCNLLKATAIDVKNEPLANASFVMNELFSLYRNYANYWIQLQERKYKNSWNTLQDTIDDLIHVAKWSNDRSLFFLDILDNHFKELEKLYPYKVFASVEMVISKETCNICGRDVLDFECTHIPGNLYWGEMAYSIVGDINFKAVALVSHPLDKRCIMEVQGDNRTEEEKFKLLDYFISNISNPLLLFVVTEHKKLYIKEIKQKLGRNDKCYCGSGKKFKVCCGKEKYEEGIHYVIAPKDAIKLNLPL
jgi:hypothetical protein